MSYNLEMVEFSVERRAAIPPLGKKDIEGMAYILPRTLR